MPRGDRTGPMGMGPVTGRGTGFCIGNAVPGCTINVGAGSGRALGGGRGFRRMFYYTGIPGWIRNGYVTPFHKDQSYDEQAALKNQEEILEAQLKQVKDRLKSFEEQN